MTASATYNGQLRTSVVHIKSGNQILTDAPTDNQGKGEAFSPTDLVAAALGSCILTIMGIAARNHEIDIIGATTEITKTMASNPRRIAKLEVVVNMPKHDYSKKEKRILDVAAHGCPVAQSLHPDLEEVIVINW